MMPQRTLVCGARAAALSEAAVILDVAFMARTHASPMVASACLKNAQGLLAYRRSDRRMSGRRRRTWSAVALVLMAALRSTQAMPQCPC